MGYFTCLEIIKLQEYPSYMPFPGRRSVLPTSATSRARAQNRVVKDLLSFIAPLGFLQPLIIIL